MIDEPRVDYKGNVYALRQGNIVYVRKTKMVIDNTLAFNYVTGRRQPKMERMSYRLFRLVTRMELPNRVVTDLGPTWSIRRASK